jgi:hypothetical protein
MDRKKPMCFGAIFGIDQVYRLLFGITSLQKS